MSPRWRWFLPGYVWSLLNTLIGLLLCVWYRPKGWAWHQGVLTCVAPKERVIGHPGAQTWGWLVIYTDPFYVTGDWAADLRVHEYTHVVQGFILGPLFLVAYAVLFLINYLRAPGAGWFPAYEAIWFEEQARRYGEGYKPGDKAWGA